MNKLLKGNSRGFIFTLDAVFSLIVASAAVSLLLYVHFTSPITPAAAPSLEAMSVMHNMLSTQLAAILQSGIALPPMQAYKLPSSSEPFGYAGFLSNGSYMSAPTEPVSGQSLTLSFWVKPIATGRYVSGCGSSGSGGDNSSVIIYLGNKTDSVEVGYNSSGGVYVGGLNENCLASSMGSVPQGAWTNIIIRQNSTTDAIFINGVQSGSTAASESASIKGMFAGSSLGGTGNGNLGLYNFTGYVANIQLYNTSFTQSKIYQLYKSAINSVPIGNSKLIGWWPMDSNANDYSGNGNDGVPVNVNFVRTDYLPIGSYNATLNSSIAETLGELYLNNNSMYAQFLLNDSVLGQPRDGLYINGNYSSSESTSFFNVTAGSYAIVYNNSVLNVGRPNFTISAWIYPESFGTCGTAADPTCIIIDKGGSYAVGINSSGSVCVQLDGTSLGSAWNCTKTVLVPREWAGIEISRNATITNISYDGGVIKNVYATGNVISDYNNTMIGAEGSPGAISGVFNGSIANLEIYNKTFTPDEIYGVYQNGISGMAVSNSSLVGWWPLTGNTNDYSGNGDAAIPYKIGYVSIGFTPPSLINAYTVSKSSVPMSLKHDGRVGIYNLSVVIWR